MKKLAIVVGIFFVFSALGIYFTKDYRYRDYAIEQKSLQVKSYKINLNLASFEDFDALPGVGPKLAKVIVDDRATNGRFNSVEDLKRVKGIGDKKFQTIKPYLTLEVY